ncbi:GNAT family N-acetyltransferase [Oceanisphaera sediminis]|uniref:GNAT family N-acetyltransferase n=1 Tax=Oceanisphaera sediminis TaxID=981381 RepID=A0ABP7DQY8_9GAMM
MSNKNKYRQLCEKEITIPIFSQAWWLDSVAGDGWDVVLVEKGDEIHASMPYVTKKKYGLTILSQPALTQHLGPWLRPSVAKYARRLAQEKDLLQALYSQLPMHVHYSQNWHHQCTNWLPLHWMGYAQTTRYTYIINELNDLDMVNKNFDTNIRTDIRKAQNKAGVKVVTDLPIDTFLKLNRKVFSRQGMTLPYSEELVKRIDKNATSRNAGKCFIAVDEQGRHHAGVYIIWDNNSAYYLLGGGDPDLRNSGATSLCMWEAIQFAATVTKSFDFEGSMIEPIERFFRAFGAQQVPYFSVSRTQSRFLKAALTLRTILKS